MKSSQFVNEDYKNDALVSEVSAKGLKMIGMLMKSKGYSAKTSRQSALYQTDFTKPGSDKVYSIDGWHGTGSGNRNYGNMKTVFALYSHNSKPPYDHKQIMDNQTADKYNMTPQEQKEVINRIFSWLEKNA